MSEFALIAPILILLMFGMTYAAFYAFRAASANWGIFITGVARGAYKSPGLGRHASQCCGRICGDACKHLRLAGERCAHKLTWKTRAIGCLAFA